MNSKSGWTQKSNNWIMLILGIVMIMIGYMSWGVITISYKAPIYKTIGVLFTCVMFAWYLIFVICLVKAKKYVEMQQVFSLSVIGFCVTLLLFVCGDRVSILVLGWIVVFAIAASYMIITQKKLVYDFGGEQIIKKYIGLFLLLLLTLAITYDQDAVQFKWDGLLYYITCHNIDISSLSNLAIYGHIAQTYGMLIGIGNLIVGDTAIVMIGLNVLLMLCSICGFYAVLKELVPNKNESQYLITTAVYAWSPFLLGMVHYHSLDFYCQCFFTLVLYALYKRKWVYFSVFSLLFCFTKEPAIVIYAATCAGVVIVDFIQDREFSLVEKIRRLFKRPKYYLMVVPGILWLATYKMLGPWSAGNGGFLVDFEYVLHKLQNLYILNFNWIFTILAIGGSIYVLWKKEWKTFQLLIPIWCSQIAFTLFSCLFKTVNHPRYNDTNQITLYLLALIPLLCYCVKMKYQIVTGILCLLCLVSSFITIDPLTRNCYEKVNIGTTTMIYTSDKPLGDGMIYNRQMLGFETALSMALEDALENSDNIMFPTISNNAYAFDGMAEVGIIQDNYMLETEIWETLNKCRTVYESSNTREFQTYQLTDKVNWAELEQNLSGKVNYIYIPSIENAYSDHIMQNYTIMEEEEYEHRGWVVKRICFNINE